MKRTTRYLPALLSGMSALIFAAGTAVAGPDTTATPSTHSTTPSATSTNSMKSTNMSGTAQTKFDSLDTNNDGSISKSEAQASTRLNKEFGTLDANKDNKLSMTEFMSASDLASIKVDNKSKAKGY